MPRTWTTLLHGGRPHVRWVNSHKSLLYNRTMSVDWLAVCSKLKGLQDARCITESILRAASSDIETIVRCASVVAPTCSPNLASELVDTVYGALINVFTNLGSSSCSFTHLDSVAQQCVVSLTCLPGLCFSGTIQGNFQAVPAHMARLNKSGILVAWVDVAERLASELQRLQQMQIQDHRSITALDVAGALLTFWVPLIGLSKDIRGLSMCEPTLVTAAKLAAAVMHMWRCTRSSPSTPKQSFTEIVRVKATQAALDAGNALASILNPVAQPEPLENVPAGILTSDAALHILCAHLAYNTLVLHQRRRGAAAVELATGASSSSSSKISKKNKDNAASAVPGHHIELLTALGLDGYTDIDEDQTASAQTVDGSCRALALVLQSRGARAHLEQQQGEFTAIPQQLCSPLLQVGIEQLLLLGAGDVLCVSAILDFMQMVMWCGMPMRGLDGATTAATAAVITAAAEEHLRKGTQLKLLLQAGPIVLAAATQGSLVGVAPVQDDIVQGCMMQLLFRLYRVATQGGFIGPVFQVAPLTASTVLEAVIRSQTWQQQAAADPDTPPILLGMIQQILASMGEAAADGGLASSSPAAEANAAATRGVLLVQVPGGTLKRHASYCLLISCLKYAAAVCTQQQCRWAGISVAAGVAKVIRSVAEGMASMPSVDSCGGSNSSGSSGASNEWEASIRLLTILAARCLQLLAVLLDRSFEAAGSRLAPQQTPSEMAAVVSLSASDITSSTMICTNWLQKVLDSHSQLLKWPLEVQTGLASKAALASTASLTLDFQRHQQQQQEPALLAMVGETPEPQAHLDRLHQVLLAVPVDASRHWHELAEAVQDQVPLRFCCNNKGCTQLKGLGELESIAGKACSRCKMARYCSVACQQAAWPRHRAVCKRLRQGAQ